MGKIKMLLKIVELIGKEDHFSLYKEYENLKLEDKDLLSIAKNIGKYNLESLKEELIKFFLNKMIPNTIYFEESVRMIKFTNKLFEEAENLKEEKNDYADEVVKLYTESLKRFVKGNDLLEDKVDRFLE